MSYSDSDSSDNENNSLNENNSFNDSDDDQSLDDSIESPIKVNQTINITTEGILHSQLSGKLPFQIVQCECCMRIYKVDDEMVIYANDMFTCYHCLFWMNYSIESRASVDGTMGKTIALYIVECNEAHDQTKCNRSGSCFLCDYKNDVYIDGIVSSEMVNGNKSKMPTVNVENSDSDYEITIDI